jgi:hypothetical protein
MTTRREFLRRLLAAAAVAALPAPSVVRCFSGGAATGMSASSALDAIRVMPPLDLVCFSFVEKPVNPDCVFSSPIQFAEGATLHEEPILRTHPPTG